MKKLYGVTVAMITPYDENGQVCLAAVGKLTHFLVSKGVQCLYPCGTTGEMYNLSEKERKNIAKTVVEEAKGKVNVFIHVGAMSIDETIRLAKHSVQIGADGIGVVTPSYFKLTDRELYEYYIRIAKSVPDNFPIYLYNIPQCSGNDLTPEVVSDIVSTAKNVIGIKYSFVDFIRTSQYIQVGKNFSVVIGADILFHAGLSMGCTGTVSGVASVYPEPFVSLYNAYLDGNEDLARELQKECIAIANLLKNGSNMAYFKAALAHRGLEVGGMRAPLLDLQEGEKKKLIAQLIKWENLFLERR